MNTHDMGTVNHCFEERQINRNSLSTVSVAELGLLVKLNHFLPTDWIFFSVSRGAQFHRFLFFILGES